jgi:ankyrin repeat protein
MILLLFLALFLRFSVSDCMESEYSTQWTCLPKDIKAKIFACADLEDKKNLRLTCTELFFLNPKYFLIHSPLILSRKEHIYHMVSTAKNHETELFFNLLLNRSYCHHTDALGIAVYFMAQESYELELLQDYFKYPNSVVLKELLPYIMEVYKGDSYILDRYKIKCKEHPEEVGAMNPLNIAVCAHHPVAVAELLLTQNKELLNMKALDDGYTPLADAVYTLDLPMCKFLLSFQEINTAILCHNGDAALHIAIQVNNRDIARLLLDHGADVNILNKAKQTPLWIASREGFDTMVELLLEYNADTKIAASDDGNLTPLCIAMLNGHLFIVRMLLKSGANPNIEIDNRTLLFFAVENDDCDLAQLLLTKGAEIDVVDYAGYTPLLRAVRDQRLNMVELLLNHNANVNARINNNMHGILDIAFSTGNEELIDFLFTKIDFDTDQKL